jgi:Tfp pilus assembly protein PilW
MKKGFTLLELLIAFLISILVIVSVYNILNSTINYSASSKQESEKINMKYNLTRLITDDITSVTDNNILKSSSFGNTTVSFSTLNTLVLNKMISIKVTYLYEKNILYRIEENEETGLY